MSRIVQTLLDLYEKKATGLLKVSCDNFIKQIYFKNGSPVYVDSNIREENLGEILVREGKLNREQHNEVIAYMLENNRRQGEAIVELGMMSGLEVFQALENQIKEKLVNCLAAEKVDTVWRAGEEEVDQVMEFSIDLHEVLFRGIKEKYSLERIKKDWNVRRDEYFYPCSEKREFLQRLKLSGDEQKILRLANGKNTLEEILKAPGADSKMAFKLLFALLLLGLVKAGEMKAEEKGAVPQTKLPPAPKTHPAAAPKVSPPHPDAAVSRAVRPEAPSENDLYLFFLKISYLDHFRCLNVGSEAGAMEIKSAYHELVHRYHLDEIGKHYQGKAAEQAQALFDRLTLAYTVLFNPQHKLKYLSEVRQGQGKKTPDPKLLAEVELRKANLFLDKKQEEEAISYLDRALAHDPDNAFYFSQRALAHLRMFDRLLRIESGKKGESEKVAELKHKVEQDLQEAQRKNPRCFEALAISGTYFRLCGEIEKAKGVLQKALEIKPNDPKVLLELKVLESQKGKGEGSLFGIKFKK